MDLAIHSEPLRSTEYSFERHARGPVAPFLNACSLDQEETIMQLHPPELQVFVEDRHHTIALQARQARGSQAVKAPAKGQAGWLPSWLSLARLQALVGFGAKADRTTARSSSVQSSKPQEQCC